MFIETGQYTPLSLQRFPENCSNPVKKTEKRTPDILKTVDKPFKTQLYRQI